jgi:hypothetical protein
MERYPQIPPFVSVGFTFVLQAYMHTWL